MMTTAHSSLFPEELFSHLPLFWPLLPGGTREVLIVVGAIAAISIVVVGWAMFVHKPGRHHHHRHHRKEQRPATGVSEHQPGRKWRRRRRKDRRPRNPTLAETGGLPPTRSTPPVDTDL